MRFSALNQWRRSNRNSRITRSLALGMAAAVAQVLPDSRALALSGTWSNPGLTSGSWGNAANWFDFTIANGSGFTADFGATNLTADNTVTLDMNRTIGNLVFGDQVPSHNWFLNGNGSALNLAVASGTPLINVENQTAKIDTVLTGTQGLAKTGAGKLILNGLNVYTGGTFVNAGTLAVVSTGAVLPAGGNVVLNSGATFNYGDGATINNSTGAIGTLTLNSGTYRVSGGLGDFYLNKLAIGNSGGTIDLTGTSNHWTHFTGSAAGITVDADSAWTGAGSSRFQNDTSALLPVRIAANRTVTSSVSFSNGISGFGYRLEGGSTTSVLYLKNPTATNTADFRIEVGSVRVDDMNALGSGGITLAGTRINTGHPDTFAVLWYSGLTASSAKPLALDDAGGNIYLSNFGTSLTLGGVISEVGGTGRALNVWGVNNTPTTLALNGANTYTGPTSVSVNGTLSIPTFENGGVASPLGASSSAPANLILGGGFFGGNGTLRYTGSTATTDRGATLASASSKATIDVATAGTTLTMSGQLVGAGGLTKAGPGTLQLANANTYANGTTVDGGTLAVGVSGTVLPAGKNLTVNSGATFDLGLGTTVSNTTAGAIGTLTLNNGTYRVSGGDGDFYLNKLVIGPTGGTVNFAGTSNFWTHFTGTDAGITVNANTTWTGAADSRLRNDTGALLPVTLINNSTLTSSVNFSNGTSGFGYRLTGTSGLIGTLYLKNPTGSNTANFRVEQAFLRVDTLTALGTGTVTLAGFPFNSATPETPGILLYTGETATATKSLTLDAGGGTISVVSPDRTLTLDGLIDETGGTGRALSFWGTLVAGSTSTLALTAANTYTGPTFVASNGILSIASIANGGVASPIGASSAAPANLQLGGGSQGGNGTLRYTGPTASTNRGLTMTGPSFKSIIDVATAATTLTMSGDFVGSGGLTKAGPGRLVLNATTPSAINFTTTVTAGTLEATAPTYNAILNNAGGLDLKGGKFVFNYIGTTTPLATVKNILTVGYNQATKFSTTQIRATGLPANRTLGYGDNGSAVTVMLTIDGDADLNGVVNFNDFLLLQNNFNNNGTTFAQGNFNYDAATNFNDFLVLQNNFGQSLSGAPMPVTAAEVAALQAFAASAVPEPAGLTLLGAAAALAGRRRRVIE